MAFDFDMDLSAHVKKALEKNSEETSTSLTASGSASAEGHKTKYLISPNFVNGSLSNEGK